MAPPPPELMEELVEEILLHFPPHEPARLVHAALVCKRWCHLISAPGFRRRFCKLHRTPPMLGFHYRSIADDGDNVGHFVPISAFRLPRAVTSSWRALDARHGRILLRSLGKRFGSDIALAVWDPITDEKRKLPLLPRNRSTWVAAVLCFAAGACDHLDCQRGPFLVVVVATNTGGTFICTCSSDDDAWSEPIFSQQNGVCVDSTMHGTLMGSALYFGILMPDKALRVSVSSL
ncbi:unnamed protein product [Urochloa decumbens]|uniref:F-box domain-containing protein n=1 Tax=Urochloa decumbens TaxID=240449 RepID=A0ABC9GEW3_9POAL